MKAYWSWIAWSGFTVVLVAYLSWSLLVREDKSLFLVGQTTDGHHQIELACESCHSSPFGGTALLQDACENCHLEELQNIRDSHPRKKFTDPANADRVALLDARVCVTCHREHQEDITRPMAVTVPDDVCFVCHAKVGEERESHKGLAFDTCASSGCHNFHDNLALYEDFLLANADKPWLSDTALVQPLTAIAAALAKTPEPGLTLAQADAPTAFSKDAAILDEWSGSGHAQVGINCSDCHQRDNQSDGQNSTLFVEKPAVQELCSSCHSDQNKGFLAGKHGMRLAAGLGAMTPAMARIPMQTSARHEELSCISCHGPHDAQRQLAAVDACMSCHNSEHVVAFPTSPHGMLVKQGQSGQLAEEATVTCATCHMPRETSKIAGVNVTHVQHNQNANLRPSDKMLRSVCLSCHSLEFSLDALADQALVNRNFTGKPALHVESIDMAVKRKAEIMKDRDSTYH